MDELIKRLHRYTENCVAYKLDADFADAVQQAADAIEFLQTYKIALENIVSMGGWWLVGKDKALHRMNVPMNWPPEGTKTVEVFPLPEPPKEE